MKYREIIESDFDSDRAAAKAQKLLKSANAKQASASRAASKTLDEDKPLDPAAANKRADKMAAIGDQRRAAQQQFAAKMQALSQKAANL